MRFVSLLVILVSPFSVAYIDHCSPTHSKFCNSESYKSIVLSGATGKPY